MTDNVTVDHIEVVFIAGHFDGPTAWAIEQNVRRAEDAALKVWRVGMMPVCPHLIGRHFYGEIPEDIAKACDLALLKRCDALYCFHHDWRTSSGTVGEVEAAERWGIPVFFGFNKLLAWRDKRRAMQEQHRRRWNHA